MCVSGLIFPDSNESIRKTYELPQHCNTCFFVRQPLRKDTEFEWQPYLEHQSAILLALTGAQAYMHSRDVALDHVVCLLRALPLCLARRCIAHVRYLHPGR